MINLPAMKAKQLGRRCVLANVDRRESRDMEFTSFSVVYVHRPLSGPSHYYIPAQPNISVHAQPNISNVNIEWIN